MVLRTSTIEEPRSVTGIIIRDEHVHYAEMAGTVGFRVQENERVYVGAGVATIQEPNIVRAAVGHLSIVESQAMDIQYRRTAISVTNAEVQRLNNHMSNMVNGRMHNFSSLNLSEVYSLRDDLNQVISTRNQINIDDGVAARDSLGRDQELHNAMMEAYSQNVYADVSGIMSRRIDGWESYWTLNSIDNLSQKDVSETMEFDALLPPQDVQPGDPVFKIVGNIWYIAAYMPNDLIEDFTAGHTRTIYLRNVNSDSYEPHSLRIQSIDYGINYSLVVFRNTRYVIDFLNQRNVSIRISSGIQQGLKLPDTAIATRQHYRIPIEYIYGVSERYVLLFAEDGNVPVPVTIDEYTDYYAYVPAAQSLGFGSILVPRSYHDPHLRLSDEHLHLRHGVYVEVWGVADFTAINIGESSPAAGYVLLDPMLNPGISEFTHIVIDASRVEDGQILRR